MFYRTVYTRSWRIVKNNFSLLFFGLFASLLGFYELKVLFNLSDTTPDFISANIESWINVILTLSIADFGLVSIPGLLSLMGLFIVFSIAIILAVACQGTLVAAAAKEKKINTPIIKQLKIGVEKFWPLLGLNIINSLIGYFFVGLVVVPLIWFLANSHIWSIYIIMALFTFFILVPLIIVLSFVTRYGSAYVVLKNQNLKNAFINSWNLFKLNWVITLENAFVMLMITALFFLVMFTTLVFLFTPFLILATFASASTVLFWFIILVGSVLGVLLLIIGTAFYGAYYNITWTSVWLNLIAPGKSHSKIHRLAHKHLPRLTQ